MNVSHDVDDMGHLHGADEMESLAMETEHNGDITPSEHGQVVDRSSEDPINTGASRSEIASTTESSPRCVSMCLYMYVCIYVCMHTVYVCMYTHL